MTSRTEVAEFVQRAKQAVDAWRSQDIPVVSWRGATVKSMSESVLEALDSLAEMACKCENVEPDARSLVLAADALAEELLAWAAAVEVDPQAVNPAGNQELWVAYEAIMEALVEPPRRLPEPINELTDQGVSLEQIAKIYGFFDEHGRPSARMVLEEKEKPGTHYNSSTWVEPARRRRQSEIDERWKDRKPVTYEALTGQRERPVAPETIEELLAQGVSAKQIAKMKNLTESQVKEFAAELGVVADGKFRRPPTPDEEKQEQASKAQRQSDLYPESHPDQTVMEERILACWADGWKAAQIAEVLQPDWPGLTWQKASAVIKAFEKSEEQEPAETAS